MEVWTANETHAKASTARNQVLRTLFKTKSEKAGKTAGSDSFEDLCDCLAGIDARLGGDQDPRRSLVPYSVHSGDGSLLKINSAAAAMFGACPERLAGRGFLDYIHVGDRVAAAHAYRDALSNDCSDGVEFRPLPHGAGDADGKRPQWLEVSLRPLNFDDKAAFLAIYRDVSNRHELFETLQRFRDEAERDSIAKSHFFASVSHELRTPLNAILGFSEILSSPQMCNTDEEKRREYGGLIHESAQHLLAVLNDILDMSKIASGNYEILPEAFKLGDALSGTVAIMRGQGEVRRIAIEEIGFDDLPEIVADKRAVRQIVINLISNALKFSEPGQQVRVRAERFARRVCIHVEDDGIGISPEHLENLGKPFFQADSKYDRKYEGTGLGLSVVKGLTELHGGKISFRSERNQGTTVSVELPIHGDRTRPGDARHELVTRLPSGKNTRKAAAASNSSKREYKSIRSTA